MNVEEFLQSGIIEMYCMGIVSEQERHLVREFSERFPEVRKEIEEVNKTLQIYAAAEGKTLGGSLKERIMKRILVESADGNLPPLVKDKQDVSFWLSYLVRNKKFAPADFEDIFSLDLASDDKRVSYVVWAKKGASVEESHDSEDEYLFMLRGSCSVICNRVGQLYHAGDLVYVPKNVVHKAISFSDDMLLIGQRLAA